MTDIPNLNIGPIGSVQITNNFELKKPDEALFDNAPIDITIWSFFGKIFIGIIIWLCVSFLNIACLSIIGFTAEKTSAPLWILLPIIGFVSSLIWNSVLAFLFNQFFSKKYYNLWKMLWLIFLSSIILLVFFFILYQLFSTNNELFLVFGFQIIFSIFLTLNLIDFLAQPNYSASCLIGNTLGCVLSATIFLALRTVFTSKSTELQKDTITILCIASSLLAYSMTILWSEIRNWIYYKLYEWWNNPFYLPSLNELRESRKKEELKKQKEDEEINVEM